MLPLTELSEVSTLDEEVETLLELAFVADRAASILEDELERLTLEAWLVVMLLLVVASAESTLAEDRESKLELALMTPSRASTLDDELERLRLDV